MKPPRRLLQFSLAPRRTLSPTQSPNVLAKRENQPLESNLRPVAERQTRPPQSVRKNPAVIGGVVTASATVIAAAVTAGVTLLSPQSSSPVNVNVGQSQTSNSCPLITENYYSIIQGNPGIMKALIKVVAADADARRCGIDAKTLELMQKLCVTAAAEKVYRPQSPADIRIALHVTSVRPFAAISKQTG